MSSVPRKAAWIAMIFAIVGIVVAGGALLRSARAQPVASDPIGQRADSVPLVTPPNGETAPALLPALASTPTPAPGVSKVPATVRLVVPAGGIDIRVVEGDGVHVPLSTAMHYPGTSEPGAGSNSLFYGHGQPGMFLGLYSVRIGDEIQAVRADGSIVRFNITDIHRVPWNDLEITKPTHSEQVVLLTCTSYNPNDPRFLVIGTLA